MKIVVDIDNTVVDYRYSLYQFIKKSNVNLGEIKPDYKMSSIKNAIKKSYGDIFWQVVQGYIYSDISKDVFFYENFNNFLRKAFHFSAEVYLVSHKTKFGLHQAKNIHIRNISFNRVESWLEREKLSNSIKDIVFTDTFDEKVDFIKKLNPQVIIDDLLEIHKKFISNRDTNEKNINILFEGNNYGKVISNSGNIVKANSWLEIIEFLFN